MPNIRLSIKIKEVEKNMQFILVLSFQEAWLIFYSNLLYKIGQDFLDIQYKYLAKIASVDGLWWGGSVQNITRRRNIPDSRLHKKPQLVSVKIRKEYQG